jgi:hypothetical protein
MVVFLNGAAHAATPRAIVQTRASAKIPRPYRNNAISLRAEFKPRMKRVRNLPNL